MLNKEIETLAHLSDLVVNSSLCKLKEREEEGVEQSMYDACIIILVIYVSQRSVIQNYNYSIHLMHISSHYFGKSILSSPGVSDICSPRKCVPL